MDIILAYTSEAPNKIDKQISNQITIEGVLREPTSVINPIINIESINPRDKNYAYIPEFGRYYYITKITSVINGIWRLEMRVDVLKSFATQIKEIPVILSDSSVTGVNDYLNSDIWINNAKQFTDIISFSNGLSENGEYILITAGG